MELIVGVLFVAGLLWASKKAVEHVAAEFRKSRLGKAGPRHAMAWFTGEAVRGFPVTRAGFQSGWLAHQTAMAQYRARREEARTSHLEARASILSELTAHRRRQAEAQARIDAAQAPQDEPADADEPADELAARRASRRVDGEPETEADRRFFDERESGYDGPLNQDGRRPNMNDPQERRDAETLAALSGRTPPSPEGIQHMANATDTNYTTVLTSADNQAELADASAADIRNLRIQAELMLEGMEAANMDPASLADQADHVARLRAAEQALNGVTESGAQVSKGLKVRHGGIKEAHDDAPVEAAESGFYQE